MTLPNFLEVGLQAVGFRPKAPTIYDVPMLQKAIVGVDGLGRTNPVNYQQIGGTIKWLNPKNQVLRDKLVGQVGRVNKYFATKAATLPWTLWKTVDGKPVQLPTHPLLELLWQPNPMVGQVAFGRQISTLYHGSGNVFIWANRLDSGARKGQATEFWVLPEGHTKPMGGGHMKPVEFYRYTPDLSKEGEYIDLPVEDVLHLKNDPLPGEEMGMSTIQSANREVTGDLAASTAQISLMQNQGPKGIIAFPPDSQGVATGMSEVQKQQLRERIMQDYTGPTKRGLLPIVTEKVEYVQIGVSAVDLEIMAYLEANFRAICSWWGLPSELLGDKEKSTYNNVAEARKAAYTDGILPYLEEVVAEFSRWACPMFEKGTWLQVDTSGVPELQQDKASLVAWLKEAWWIPVERRAEIMGEAANPKFTGYFVPAMYVHIKSTDELSELLTDEGQKLLGRYNEYPGVQQE